MKIKSLLIILALGFIFYSCGKDNNDSYDAAEQSQIDDEALIEYLQTHYLNEEDDAIWTITNGETPLMDQVLVDNIINDDVSYKLYYLVQNEGVADIYPSRADSILNTYAGILLDSTRFDYNSIPKWFSLTGLIDGWGYGFSHFKGGEKIIAEDDSFTYENSGEGYLFIPSGLGYQNRAQSGIEKNSPLIFKITLNAVNEADHDNDGVLSKNEDIDNDGNVKNDDSDGDLTPDYLDIDDDGDRVLTKYEILEGDTDGDGIQNYLDDDDDGDGILSRKESSTLDTDNDGIVNYLDADS